MQRRIVSDNEKFCHKHYTLMHSVIAFFGVVRFRQQHVAVYLGDIV